MTNTENIPSNIISILEDLVEESMNGNDTPEVNTQDIIEETNNVENTPATLQSNVGIIRTDINHARFSSASWFESMKNIEIVLAGLGGIGSWVALLLSRLNIGYLTLIDIDVVEAVNMAGQCFRGKDINKNKTVACSDIITEFSNYYKIRGSNTNIEDYCPIAPIMICGFDNMSARKSYYNSWKNQLNSIPEKALNKCLFIDGRMSAEFLQIFCLTGNDVRNQKIYEDSYLFDSSQAENTVCSYKQTSYISCMIASLISNLLINHVCNNTQDVVIDRDLPFYTEYNAENLYLKTVI